MSSTVELYIYDLSNGMAAALSPLLTGKRVDGIWHTSIVVYQREYFFGSHGVESCTPGATALGPPLKKVVLGETQIPHDLFVEYLNDLSESSYTAASYNLLYHNCNNFTNDIAHFLCGVGIPQYILDLPNEVLNSRLGAAVHSLVSQLEKSARPIAEERSRSPLREEHKDFEQVDLQIEQARYNSFLLEQRKKTLKERLARKEHNKDTKKKKASAGESTNMAEAEALNGVEEQLPSEQAMALEEEERKEEEEKKKLREPPIVYKDLIDIKAEFDTLIEMLDRKLSPEEQRSMEELHQYMIGDEGSWALGDDFLNFIGRLLNDEQLPIDVRVKTLNILAMAALKDDVILLLHQDRREHVLMNYIFEIDRVTDQEQEATALFMANMFENTSSSEWLLYISEWTYKNQQISNIRVTTKVAAHCLLSDSPVLQDRGAAIVYNLACKEVKTVVFDDVAVELTMAILQYFNVSPSEEHLFRCMKALAKFAEVSSHEVPQLIQMIGPDPRNFKGTSERVDQMIDLIACRLG